MKIKNDERSKLNGYWSVILTYNCQVYFAISCLCYFKIYTTTIDA